jgi:hypothetical protein
MSNYDDILEEQNKQLRQKIEDAKVVLVGLEEKIAKRNKEKEDYYKKLKEECNSKPQSIGGFGFSQFAMPMIRKMFENKNEKEELPKEP